LSVDVFALPWGATFLPAMRRSELTNFFVGWIADYADADNFAVPFCHSQAGVFAKRQQLNYGDIAGVPNSKITTADFDPTSGRTAGGGLYTNWEGTTWNLDTTGLNNTYVDGLIEDAGTADPADRPAMYSEIEDIYYAACGSVVLAQPLVRHWERHWIEGWYFCPIGPGGWATYAYHLWKGLAADITGDGVVDGDDVTPINEYFFDAFWDGMNWVEIVGPSGYNRIADISSDTTYPVTGEVRTWEYDGTEMDWGYHGYLPGSELPGVDGFVNVYDQALISAELYSEAIEY
jgi:hypothetical protein